jgi:hypothetical protein
MKVYKVTEGVSGQTEVIRADNPRLAVIKYLVYDTNPNDSCICNYDFEVEAVRREIDG